MKLAVCGCSWSSRDPNLPNHEFGQFIADYYDADYTNLAIPACTNFGIRLQIDHAIDVLDADFVIINATTPTRIDFKINNSDRYTHQKGWENIDKTLLTDSLGSVFQDDLDTSFDENHIQERLSKVMNKDTHAILKQYFLHFYDPDIERHKQYYILQNGLDKLLKTNTKFIFSPNTFEWAEGMSMSNSLLEYNAEPFEWQIPQANYMQKGIAEYLKVCDELYGSWENSPGVNTCNHLPIESHIEFSKYAINLINKII
jgi:hypothetical protein|tara:strand:- start:11951 stop:12721 length:771 start_codon:yes stop_codon:yes gene_type:complete